MKGRVYAWLTALAAAVVLGCTGCGITVADPADSRKGEDDSLVKEQAVTTREQAREIMGTYLEDKYGLSYEVQLPHRNDTGDFQAQAYPEGDVNSDIYIMTDIETGECRDSGCLDLVETYVEKKLNEVQETEWEKCRIQILCSFWDDVPEQEWGTDADPREIVQDENVHCQIFLMIPDEEPVKEQEAERISRLLSDGCLNGMRITLEGYYVDDAVYVSSEEQLADGRAMMLADCGESYENKVTVRWNSGDEPLDSEEIISGFNR